MGADEVVEEGTKKAAWGTWEELLLGGAVLRHGADDWGAVASELRARTAFPFNFTAEVWFLPRLIHFKQKQVMFLFLFVCLVKISLKKKKGDNIL